MSTAATQLTDGIDDATKASPDWINSEEGSLERRNVSNEQRHAGENHVELKYRSLENLANDKFARGLGMFSIALGLAEVLAPGQMARLSGISDKYRSFLPLMGAREIAHGLGIMNSTKPTTAVWTRVGGDALDLALLGAAARDKNANTKRLAIAAAAVLGVTALDVLCAQRLSSNPWSEADGNPYAPTTVGQPSARASAAM